MIENAKQNAKQHLQYSQNHGHFHLVRVGEHQFVLRHVPNLEGGREGTQNYFTENVDHVTLKKDGLLHNRIGQFLAENHGL